jgi:hypothetical protein
MDYVMMPNMPEKEEQLWPRFCWGVGQQLKKQFITAQIKSLSGGRIHACQLIMQGLRHSALYQGMMCIFRCYSSNSTSRWMFSMTARVSVASFQAKT